VKPLFAAFLALAAAACGGARAWNYDETERISDVMACKRFDPDLPEARGIPLDLMPPQAKPSPRSLSLEDGKGSPTRKLGSVTPARRKPAKARAAPKEK
jgi:hypothetical protein